MRTKLWSVMAAVTVLLGMGTFAAFDAWTSASAQTTSPDDKKMPDVVILGKEAKLGQVTFNHIKHNGGAYNIDKSSPIACISCHHAAQPQSEVAKHPPLMTAWPADRTTTLTAELFAKDPNGSGVVGCSSCHAREGQKPKLLDANPQIKHESSAALITLNNQQAMHRACTGCHVEVKKSFPASKGPVTAQCMMCHKKA